MQITIRCKECSMNVKIKEIYIAESGAVNIYLSCGHQNHDFELKKRRKTNNENQRTN